MRETVVAIAGILIFIAIAAYLALSCRYFWRSYKAGHPLLADDIDVQAVLWSIGAFVALVVIAVSAAERVTS